MEIEISTGKVEMKDEISWGESNQAVREADIECKAQDRQPDQVSILEYQMLKRIKKAPFSINIGSLRSLSEKDGEIIFEAMRKLKSLSESVEKNLEALPNKKK